MNDLVTAALALHPCSLMFFIFKSGSKENVVPSSSKPAFERLVKSLHCVAARLGSIQVMYVAYVLGVPNSPHGIIILVIKLATAQMQMRKTYQTNNYVSEKKVHFTIFSDNKYLATLFNKVFKSSRSMSKSEVLRKTNYFKPLVQNMAGNSVS